MNSFVRVARLCLVFIAFAAAFLFLVGCSGLSGSSGARAPLDSHPAVAGDPAAGARERGSSDVLGPGDVVIVTFSGASDPPGRHEDRIREDGYITLAFVGAVKAAGKTRAELQKEILALYVPRYFKQLTVNVNADTRTFTVDGEVRTPNRVMYLGKTTVLKAITAAGGFTDFANPKKVQIIRANGKKERVDCLKARTDPKLDLEIYPDDYIYVPRRLF